MEPDSVDSIVTDPPYGLGFMGKGWDHGIPIAWIPEALRVLKPGGHIVAFGGTRTHHRLMCAIEDAGFEIRDCLTWLYGQGFPKSLDVSKAIDKAAGATREIVGQRPSYRPNARQNLPDADPTAWQDRSNGQVSKPATDAARQWDGWGTALKPAWEPIVLARKPLGEATVAANVLKWRTGALNIDGCRIGAQAGDYDHPGNPTRAPMARNAYMAAVQGAEKVRQAEPNALGRWPANLVLSHSPGCEPTGTKRVKGGNDPRGTDGKIYRGLFRPGDAGHMPSEHAGFSDADGMETVEAWACVPECAVRLLDEQSGERPSTLIGRRPGHNYSSSVETDGGVFGHRKQGQLYGDTGGASRFFYTSKANKSERNGSKHPTVKPLDLMVWLVKLVTPPGGIVLDPFLGSGTTVEAARSAGYTAWGIDLEPEYIGDAKRRVIEGVLF